MAGDAKDIQARLRRLREHYIEALPHKLQILRDGWARLDAAWETPNLESLIRISHNLAGSAASFDFPGLSSAAHELEEQLRRLNGIPGTVAAAQRQVMRDYVDALLEAGRVAGSQGPVAGVSLAQSEIPLPPLSDDRLVYVVDDDSDSAGQLALQLRRYGYEVRLFTTHGGVAQALGEQAPVAVLMDIVAPAGGLVGMDVVAVIRHARDQLVPVMFLSSRNDLEARLHAVRIGGMAYFTKPVEVGGLVDKLDALREQRPEEFYRVMVVDDSPPMAAYYGAVLREQGMQVEVVSELGGIINLIDQFRPDLILLDPLMPGCNGLELAAVIRQKEDFISTAIVYLSAETDLDTRLQALFRGGDDFLVKPIEPRHLVAAVRMRVRRARQLRSFMVRDGLTGLLNHTAIKEQLELELARSQREKHPLCFVMIDIDHFKQVNDRYGHVMGDRVIKSLSRLLRDRLRGSDVVGRYGGEEVAVVLKGTYVQDAERLINAIREDFAAIQHPGEDGVFTVSFSGGIASFPDYADAAEMSEAADKALYAAKRAGRNRIMVAAPNQP